MLTDLTNFLIRMAVIAFMSALIYILFYFSFYAMTIARQFICSQ